MFDDKKWAKSNELNSKRNEISGLGKYKEAKKGAWADGSWIEGGERKLDRELGGEEFTGWGSGIGGCETKPLLILYVMWLGSEKEKSPRAEKADLWKTHLRSTAQVNS